VSWNGWSTTTARTVPAPPTRQSRSDGLLVATELALASVSAAAVLGMHRLFVDGAYRGPLLLQVALAHLTMAVIRRRNLSLRVALPLSLGLAAVAITWTQYADTTWLGLPSTTTLDAAHTDIVDAWRQFQDVRAPAPVEPGFITATSLAVWIIAFIADWGAFRTGVSFESLLPPATLFLFTAVLAAPGGRVGSAALFVGVALVFLLLHRTWRQEDTASWVASRHRQARRALVLAGTSLVIVAVSAAAVVGPMLPGADAAGIVSWRDIRNDDETRTVISPLVDIQTRLVEQSTMEVFTAEGDPGGPYWRLTALDDFTGTIWRSSYQTDEASDRLPTEVESLASTRRVTYRINIVGLGAIWLPAPFEPKAIDTEDRTPVDYDPASSTLIVNRDLDTSDGLAYEVTSDVPTWTADQLRNASQEIPADISERYLELPNDFSQRIVDLAQERTAEAPTPYDKAIALQSWLRNTFQYSLDVQARHSQNALEEFLFETQTGYCEQFAGAYAAMARSLGLPSRVVVGFTRGREDPNQPGLFRVTGRQAHAWVEIYFHGFGWVTFDPTPGRSPLGSSAWLDIPEEGLQDEPSSSAPATTAAPGPAPGPSTPATQPGTPPGGEEGVEVQAAPPEEEEDDGLLPVDLPDTPAAIAKPPAYGAAAYLLIVPLALIAQRHLRRRRARDPAQQVDLAWQEVNEDLTAAGLQLSASLTVAERAGRMRLALPEAAPSVDMLAHALEQVTYAERTPSNEEAAAVTAAASDVSSAAARQQPWWRRPLRWLDARRLLPARDRARRSAHGTVSASSRAASPPPPA
jgi:transglutaminase-like putative cysteine protease